MTLEGHVEDGNIVLNTPVVLPDGTKVTVSVQPDREQPSSDEELSEGRPINHDDDFASAPILAPDAWLREFDAWVSTHTSRNPHVDDSRESIYPDRW